MVFPFHRFQLLRVVLFEQCQVYVDRHGKVPESVRRHKPKAHQLPRTSTRGFEGDSSYIWMRKAWNWHRGEACPARMPDCEIILAILHRVFPHEA